MTARLIRISVGPNQSLGAIHAEPAKPLPEPRPLRPGRSSPAVAAAAPPLAIMIHDLPFGTMRDHEDLFGRIENLLTDMGICSVRFDFRGCGGSDPPPGGLLSLGSASADLAAVMAWGQAIGHTRFILIAEGLSASLCLPRIDESVTAAILLWPVLDPRQMAVAHFGADPDMSAPGPAETLMAGGRPVGLRLIYEMVRTDLRPYMKKIVVPLLIQQGDQDADAPPGQLDIARKGLRTKRLDITTYAGAGRGLTDPRHRKYMLYHIQQFLEKFS